MTTTMTPPCIPRDEMPQVDIADYPDLFAFVIGQGFGVTKLILPAKMFTPRQCAVDIRPSRRITAHLKPILCSLDMLILDGDHRWARAMAENPSTDIPSFQIGCLFNHARDLLLQFPRTYKFGDGPQPERN